MANLEHIVYHSAQCQTLPHHTMAHPARLLADPIIKEHSAGIYDYTMDAPIWRTEMSDNF